MNFNEFIHSLRTAELRRMPPGAKRVVSVGCSGAWYFDWFASGYPGVEIHYGAELFSPQPSGLPAYVRWVKTSMADLSFTGDETVDLVFAGQAIEHAWAEDLADFLLESYRILKPSHWLVIDSPNRAVTEPLNWIHPEHTAELTVAETLELVHLAGFDAVSICGLWLCYAREQHRWLPLFDTDPTGQWSDEERLRVGRTRPEDCFIWWLIARKAPRAVRRIELSTKILEIHRRVSTRRAHYFRNEIGIVEGNDHYCVVKSDPRERGYLVLGPGVPLRPGTYRAFFLLGLAETPGSKAGAGEAVGELQIHSNLTHQDLAVRRVKLAELSLGAMSTFPMRFTLNEVRFGVEFRVYSYGKAPLMVRRCVHVERETPIW